MKIFITGGTGFVGTALSRDLLKKGHQVIGTGTSSIHPGIDHRHFQHISADTTRKGSWQEALGDRDVVINLAGKNIFGFWSRDYKKKIYDSRILTTRNIVEAISGQGQISLLSTSATGYYGSRGDEILDETAGPGNDFLANVSVDWEKEALSARTKGARVAIMRFGLVLGKTGGALARMLPAFRRFLGGPMGSGKQWFPWIHLEDLVRAAEFIMDRPGISGPVNFCAPEQIRQGEFARALGRALNRPTLFRTPAIALRTMGGELGSLLLSSQRVLPAKLAQEGFTHRYPEVEQALADLVG